MLVNSVLAAPLTVQFVLGEAVQSQGVWAVWWELGAQTHAAPLRTQPGDIPFLFGVPWHVEEAVSTVHIITEDSTASGASSDTSQQSGSDMGRDAASIRTLFCFTNQKMLSWFTFRAPVRARCLQKSMFSLIYSPAKMAHTSFRTELNTCEFCTGQSSLVELAGTSAAHCWHYYLPLQWHCTRGFLYHLTVSWLWDAFCSALQCVHLSCQAWSPAVPRRRKWVWGIPSARNLHPGGVQLLGVVFSRASVTGGELQSHCICLFE